MPVSGRGAVGLEPPPGFEAGCVVDGFVDGFPGFSVRGVSEASC